MAPAGNRMPPPPTQPVRAVDADERKRLEAGRGLGPFLAWRDPGGALAIKQLEPGVAVRIGRWIECPIAFDHLFVSREHAEVLLRASVAPESTSVFLLDLQSKHGTEHRRVESHEGALPSGQLRPAPRRPAGPLQLGQGDHDVCLAREVWIRIGGVPHDPGITAEPPDDLPQPTPREHDVLVELCRPQFDSPDRAVPPPTNARIAAGLTPRIGEARVSDIVSALYQKYELRGTPAQNRLELVELALRRRLVGPEHYT